MRTNPNIAIAIMFGRGRFQNGVLLHPPNPVNPDNESELIAYRNLVWYVFFLLSSHHGSLYNLSLPHQLEPLLVSSIFSNILYFLVVVCHRTFYACIHYFPPFRYLLFVCYMIPHLTLPSCLPYC